MGFRCSKRIKILPGFWFNPSTSGLSTSIGGKGLTVNLKDCKARTTVGKGDNVVPSVVVWDGNKLIESDRRK